jgi:hypothetical protein
MVEVNLEPAVLLAEGEEPAALLWGQVSVLALPEVLAQALVPGLAPTQAQVPALSPPVPQVEIQ